MINRLELLERIVGILARNLDPANWEALVRVAAVQAKEEIENDQKDQRTSPSLGSALVSRN